MTLKEYQKSLWGSFKLFKTIITPWKKNYWQDEDERTFNNGWNACIKVLNKKYKEVQKLVHKNGLLVP